MTIYTKKGDGGKTVLLGNRKVKISKDNLIITAIGSLDELNSYLGVAVSATEDPIIGALLKSIQSDLLQIGSIIAGSNLLFRKSKVKKLEKTIDALEVKLPKLNSFIIPGGSALASHLHYARSVARRAEREVVAVSKLEKVDKAVLSFLNRLSDCLFMLARLANQSVSLKDDIWKK